MTRACPGPCGGEEVSGDWLACKPCWDLLPRALRKAITRAWDHGNGKGSAAHQAALKAAIRVYGRLAEATPPPRPAPHELWAEAGEDPEEYRRLMIKHGHLIGPGHPRYEEAVQAQEQGCGWKPGPDDG